MTSKIIYLTHTAQGFNVNKLLAICPVCNKYNTLFLNVCQSQSEVCEHFAGRTKKRMKFLERSKTGLSSVKLPEVVISEKNNLRNKKNT